MPSGTERLLAGGRVLAKARDDRLHLLFEKKEGGALFEPLLPLTGRTLQIGLKLLTAAFSNFTELPFLFGEGLPLYRNAGADPGQLQAPVTLLLNPAHADDAELFREGLFCLVEVAVDAGFYTAPPAFAVPFQARAETLKYYVVARNYTASEFNQLDVSDAGFATDVRPEVRFDRIPPSSFTSAEIPAAQLGDGDTRVTLFRSQQPVTRQVSAPQAHPARPQQRRDHRATSPARRRGRNRGPGGPPVQNLRGAEPCRIHHPGRLRKRDQGLPTLRRRGRNGDPCLHRLHRDGDAGSAGDLLLKPTKIYLDDRYEHYFGGPRIQPLAVSVTTRPTAARTPRCSPRPARLPSTCSTTP